MPIYEYQCTSCAYRFEVKQGIKDAPITECARCGQAVSKLISPPAIMFKGSGWYVTDYSDKLKPAASADGGEKPAVETPDQAKPAVAADTASKPESSTSAAPAPAAPPSASASGTPSGNTSSSTS
ncbi:MAG TPA: FmdB family zinc ribbon protein [Nitrospiraceae bacterium]|nr:FmdB family zinc ribbon protein [Nitrospiraceae bacterium]